MANKKGNNYVIDEESNIAKIELKQRGKESLWTIIDLEDLDKVINYPYTWSLEYHADVGNYYARTSKYDGINNGKNKTITIKLHQFLMDSDGSAVVDHINHNTLDNRKSNLRIIEHGKNLINRKGKNKNNKSGYRNVSWNKKDNAWVVQLQINGKNTKLKRFPYEKLEEAGKYAEKMREKYYGEFKGLG